MPVGSFLQYLENINFQFTALKLRTSSLIEYATNLFIFGARQQPCESAITGRSGTLRQSQKGHFDRDRNIPKTSAVGSKTVQNHNT